MKSMGKAFKESDSDSFAMVVLEGQQPLGDDARTYYRELIRKLRNDPRHVEHVQDLWGDRLTAVGVQSADGKAAYVQVNLAGNQGTTLAQESVTAVRQIIKQTPPPPGVQVHLTGPAALIPDMVRAGDGYRFHVTGLPHDERGYPSMNVETQDRSIRRLIDKLKPISGPRAIFETENLDDAEVVVVSYGITSRVAQRALQLARARLISAWPFPDPHIRELAGRVKAFVVPELNLGQMVHEVARAAEGKAKVVPVSHAGGSVHNPEVILNAIVEAAR